MCFRLRPESLLLNYFYEKETEQKVSFREIQSQAQEIVKRCNGSILVELSSEILAEVASRYSAYISVRNCEFYLKPKVRKGKKFALSAQLAKQFMPISVREAMESVLRR